jgi:hypothetical protein
MDETDDFTRWQDDSQYNHAEDARPDLHGIAASVAAGGMFDVGQKQTICLREHDVCFSAITRPANVTAT